MMPAPNFNRDSLEVYKSLHPEEACGITADLHTHTRPSLLNTTPLFHPKLCSRPLALTSSSFLPPSPVNHTGLPLQTTFLYSVFFFFSPVPKSIRHSLRVHQPILQGNKLVASFISLVSIFSCTSNALISSSAQ